MVLQTDKKLKKKKSFFMYSFTHLSILVFVGEFVSGGCALMGGRKRLLLSHLSINKAHTGAKQRRLLTCHIKSAITQ